METNNPRYINPLTDFGFKKLENIADMAKLTREEREFYHVSLDSLRTN